MYSRGIINIENRLMKNTAIFSKKDKLLSYVPIFEHYPYWPELLWGMSLIDKWYQSMPNHKFICHGNDTVGSLPYLACCNFKIGTHETLAFVIPKSRFNSARYEDANRGSHTMYEDANRGSHTMYEAVTSYCAAQMFMLSEWISMRDLDKLRVLIKIENLPQFTTYLCSLKWPPPIAPQ